MLSLLQTIEFDEGAGAVLRIQPLRAPRDENIYECVAENVEGEITVNAKLSIIRGECCTAEQPERESLAWTAWTAWWCWRLATEPLQRSLATRRLLPLIVNETSFGFIKIVSLP